jgi:ABC-type sulfate/molybdate transport systems ATPase subunit
MLRAEMLELIRTAVASRKATVVYVTHSWPEVLELCERIAVLSDGRIVQEGLTSDVFQYPVDSHVARLTGAVVEVPAALVQDGHIGCDSVPSDSGDGAVWHVRPQQIRFAAPAGRNCWRILDTQPHGSGWRVFLQSDDRRWTVVATQRPQLGSVVAVSIVDSGARSGNGQAGGETGGGGGSQAERTPAGEPLLGPTPAPADSDRQPTTHG